MIISSILFLRKTVTIPLVSNVVTYLPLPRQDDKLSGGKDGTLFIFTLFLTQMLLPLPSNSTVNASELS